MGKKKKKMFGPKCQHQQRLNFLDAWIKQIVLNRFFVNEVMVYQSFFTLAPGSSPDFLGGSNSCKTKQEHPIAIEMLDTKTNKIFTHDENVKNATNKTISRMRYGRCKNLKKYTRHNIFQNTKIADFRLCACNCLYYSRFFINFINLSGSFMVYFEITKGRGRLDLRRHTDFCLILFVV